MAIDSSRAVTGRWRVALSSRAFDAALQRGSIRLEQVPATARELGYGAVEIDDAHLRALSALKQRMLDTLMQRYFGQGAFYREYTSARLLALHMAVEESDARVVAWAARTDFTLTDRLARWQMHYLEGAIAAVNDFGARLICIRAGGSPQSDADDFQHCVAGLSQAAQLAQRFHSRLALEADNGLATSVARTLELVRAVDSPSLGVCLSLHADGADFDALAPYAIHLRADAVPDGASSTRLSALHSPYAGWIALDHVESKA